MQLAKDIIVVPAEYGYRLYIGGTEFPYFIAEEGVTIESLDGGLSKLTIPVIVDGPMTIGPRLEVDSAEPDARDEEQG